MTVVSIVLLTSLPSAVVMFVVTMVSLLPSVVVVVVDVYSHSGPFNRETFCYVGRERLL